MLEILLRVNEGYLFCCCFCLFYLFLEFSVSGSGSEVCFIVEVFDVFGFFIIGLIDRRLVFIM